MDIIVLGAGVVGITTAYYLARDGHHVTVVDRRSGAGLETSFANGSQIAAHGAGPWSAPGVPLNLVKWLGKEDAPLLLRLRSIPGLWRWGPQFLRNCTADRWRRNARAIHDLASLSYRELNAVVAEHAIAYDEVRRGILVVHRTQAGLDGAQKALIDNASLGMKQVLLDRAGCLAVEPSLEPIAGDIAGGVHSPDDQTGDCFRFTQTLAGICNTLGVRFLFDTTITSLAAEGGTVTGVETDGKIIRADHVILCFGSDSTPLARHHRLYLPIYPVKGYSATVEVDGWNGAPTASLIDEKRKIGFSRLGNRLRMAGTAEFAGFDRTLNEQRHDMLMAGLSEMFPSFPKGRKAKPWSGLRPMTPDGCPVISRTKLRNLFVNAGHGTLGWTLACGSARLVAEAVRGERTAIAIEPFDVRRA